MKIKHIISLFLLVATMLSFCGCDLFKTETDALISPPELTGDMSPIKDALNKSAPAGYTLKYPSTGDRRSAVVLEDVNSDGKMEAFAFYSTIEDGITTMTVNYIRRSGDKWSSVAVQSIAAGGVERVDFCDLDGDGSEELLVGWEVHGTIDRQVAVYSPTEEALSQRMLQSYTNFTCCDLDEDGGFELFVQHLNSSEQLNRAMLFELTSMGVSQIGGCLMDSAAKAASEPVVSTLSTGQAAIYIDEVKGIGNITEVLFFSKGELVNPLLDSVETIENTKTVRAYTLSATDINGDNILEIPVASVLPSALATNNEVLYYTSWCSFNGDGLTSKLNTIVNSIDGYYVIIPEKWWGKIAVAKETEYNLRTFYYYDQETETVGDKIGYIKAVPQKSYKAEEYEGAIVLAETEDNVYLGMLVDTVGQLALTEDELKGMFKLFQ
ncbi:MAG: VCBS repeat-containing protein [Clostridia bacterium]|nr:VCBS repeat-containing protein [Clostridia bacterium]